MFDNIITSEFKNIFKESIDTILATNGLTVPCTLKYESSARALCYNCEFDPINQKSANMPRIDSTVTFANYTICPVCNGFGYIDSTKDEIVNLAIIFDSKYWLGWGSKSVNIADGAVQSLCSINLLPKIKNCKYMLMNNNLSRYGHYRYSRINEPEPAGLGDHDYIITMWQKS
jgi:hypothetical protein